MRRTLAAGLLAAALALPAAQAVAHAATASGAPTPSRERRSRARDAWEAKVREADQRPPQAHGRKPLKAAACPDSYAEPWTRHLATKQSADPPGPDPMLGCPHTSYAGENIAYGYSTPRAPWCRAWMHSPGHRANILSRHFHRIGVSGWRATNGVTYATQDFVG